MSALDALAKLQDARQKKEAKKSEVKLSDYDRGNLQIWLAGRMADGWTSEDRKEYLDACKDEFANPVAGGVEAACAFWKSKR
jgi:hypothetical protein